MVPRQPADEFGPSPDRNHVEHLLADLPQASRVPRKDQDLAFDHPWEVRVLGIAVELHQQGLFEWPEFQGSLIDEIGRWERTGPDGHEWSYYHRWLDALQRLLEQQGVLAGSEVRTRMQELLCAKPDPGHHA